MNNLFKRHEIQFIAWFSGIFLLTIAVLSGTGLIPTEFQENTPEPGLFEKMRLAFYGVPYWDGAADQTTVSKPSSHTSNHSGTSAGSSTTAIAAENPVRIVIPAIDVDTTVRNPVTTNNDILDDELQRGAVRYPGSGYPGVGNMFIFGHSTGFKIVQNKAYKVFNRLKELQPGDLIQVYSENRVYLYKVSALQKVDKNDTWVTFEPGKNLLTLSTCDSFGKRSDRYVVEADYMGVQSVK